MVDEQKLRQLAEAATPGPWISAGPSFGAKYPVYCEEVVIDRDGDDDAETVCQAPSGLEKESTNDMDYIGAANPAATLYLLDELQTLREERTAWRVTAENAEAAVKQARIDALEEARKAVSSEELTEPEDNADDAYNFGVLDCVRAVEKLKGTP